MATLLAKAFIFAILIGLAQLYPIHLSKRDNNYEHIDNGDNPAANRQPNAVNDAQANNQQSDDDSTMPVRFLLAVIIVVALGILGIVLTIGCVLSNLFFRKQEAKLQDLYKLLGTGGRDCVQDPGELTEVVVETLGYRQTGETTNTPGFMGMFRNRLPLQPQKDMVHAEEEEEAEQEQGEQKSHLHHKGKEGENGKHQEGEEKENGAHDGQADKDKKVEKNKIKLPVPPRPKEKKQEKPAVPPRPQIKAPGKTKPAVPPPPKTTAPERVKPVVPTRPKITAPERVKPVIPPRPKITAREKVKPVAPPRAKKTKAPPRNRKQKR